MDISLYVIAENLEDAEAAARGGASALQLRNKSLNDRDLFKLAIRMKSILREYNIPLFINDRVDIALASRADGAHLGQSDISPADAKRLGGKDFKIGITIDSLEDLNAANDLPVDYVAIGPIFPTSTKALKKSPVGLEGLSELRQVTRHPIVAIGGIDDSNAHSVIKAGADGIAVLSYVQKASDKASAVAALKEIIKKARY